MKPPVYISSYLVYQPVTTPRHAGWQRRLRNRLTLIWRARPLLSTRTWAALTLWAILFSGGLMSFSAHRTLPRESTVLAAESAQQITAKAPAAVKAAVHLPNGPTGQLLPPGTMAPAYTYKNTYTRGQCTWYVAGRRQIPGNWGNARTWYSSAQQAGWATGTAPAVGAIAWTPRGYYGHVALVEGVDTASGRVLVSEMNYIAPFYISQRWTSISEFKYIY